MPMRINDVNAITTPIQNTSNPQTIFVRIEDADNGCLAFTSFNLIVNPLPQITTPSPLEVCDDAVADGSTTFDLTVVENEVTNGDNSLVVTYHYSQVDADNGDNPIAMPYVNIQSERNHLYTSRKP